MMATIRQLTDQLVKKDSENAGLRARISSLEAAVTRLEFEKTNTNLKQMTGMTKTPENASEEDAGTPKSLRSIASNVA